MKHFHGRRHIRAQRSVVIGRMNRQIKKLDRFAKQVNIVSDFLNSYQFTSTMENAIKEMITAFRIIYDSIYAASVELGYNFPDQINRLDITEKKRIIERAKHIILQSPKVPHESNPTP